MVRVPGSSEGVNVPGGERPRQVIAKTFDNGLRMLEELARHPQGCTSAEVAAALGLDRTVVYRLLNTAVARRLVRTDADGRHSVGLGALELAATVDTDLRNAAAPHLAQLAETLGATAFLTVADGDDGVSVCVRAPRRTPMHVAYRTGFRHPLQRGAPGLAILAAGPERDGERPEVAAARRDGFVTTCGELQPGAWGIACPVPAAGVLASVGLVAMHPLDAAAVLPDLRSAARAIAVASG